MRKNEIINSYFYTIICFCFICLVASSCASRKKANIRQQKVNTLVKTARSYTGTPYRYGGTSRNGMDCSALLVNSFDIIGINLPRTSKEQSEQGQKVKLKDLQPGDLVFFGSKKNKRRISHAGLVTEVVNDDHVKFIHATTSLGVTESNVHSKYYKKLFREARRIF
ncbi:C40 family peptidase [Aureibacter tunicatorum]|uniref:Cell wall-associated NlpC family hydrolase n=1 Tax=Aureibacter tunicatorum TaxID=866807 RepID=A0AAE3XLJ1_9BACT|nr:C40 family peptidase [Aureibacter tunicatorum]MDR6238715.1 cell wall-associated NlpC family hydrolase [Aureibacter tunicatorum]BDD05354.1 hypothetical protein AUTU_28370 [Aureibacter tunicatorum]